MATPSAVSTQLAALTSSNTVLQMMGDINSLKTLSALASDSSSKADLANTNAYIASVASGGGLANTNLAIANLNTNLTATNTAIRALNTATQSALDTQEAKQAADLANTNSSIAGVSTTASAALPLAGGTMSGQLVVHSTGIQFSDASTLTTAPSAGITTGKAIAMAIVFG
tara:strand:+ start:2083 stop:2595 length:513 start_codon:yes stop_codon:yes gene_type:complete